MEREILAIIIPTKNRPDELRRLLNSVDSQNVRPAQIIVVDGGSISAKDIVGGFSGVPIDYATSPCSLTAQKNIGIKMLKKEITLVCFFDDDIIPEKDSLDHMMKFWEAADPDTAGASFNIMSDAYKKPTLSERVFFVNADAPGRILPSGFQSKLCSLTKTTRVEWLLGGATVWRRGIFNEFMFDERFSGYARYEDVDFSYRVGKKYKMFVEADSKVAHCNRLEDIGFSFSLGKMEILNRLYFVKKHKDLSVSLCYWASFGLFLNNMVKGLFRSDRRYRLRAKGNLAGFFESVIQFLFSRTITPHTSS